MDLSKLSFKETFSFQLKNPLTGDRLFSDGDKNKPMMVHLYSKASKQYNDVITEVQSRYLRRQNKKDTLTVHDLQRESVELLVRCTAKFENISYNGKECKTAQDFESLYTDPSVSWVKDQVNEALEDISNFLMK